MKDRIKDVRKAAGLNQTDFGKRVGVSLSAVQKWESGENVVSDSVIILICREFGVNETWLRTGAGDMHRPRSREQELGELIRSRLYDRPESFQSALVATLLRFDPDGPAMQILQKILQNLIAETKKDQEP